MFIIIVVNTLLVHGCLCARGSLLLLYIILYIYNRNHVDIILNYVMPVESCLKTGKKILKFGGNIQACEHK